MKNKNIRVSFLIAVHNEEKIIDKTLKNLVNLPYDKYEVILGLDGCTDKTEEIVKRFSKKSKRIRYFKLNSNRQGKPYVINNIINKARGDIIIINDADWIFKVGKKKDMQNLVSLFDNPQLGGLAESFPIQYPLRNGGGILEAGVLVQNFIWIDYIKRKGKKIDENWIKLNQNKFPLLVNIFRKELYRPNISLGDDFERGIDIFNRGKDIYATFNPQLPRMTTIGEVYTVAGLLKQKRRTALARSQIENKLGGRKLMPTNFLWFTFISTFKFNPKYLLGFFMLNWIFILGALQNKFSRKMSTKEGWKLRLKR